jgi:predicted acetyltransferase
VDDFLARPLCTVFLIAAEDAAAGFAWVGGGDVPRRRPDADHRLAEFFVARPFRRAGIGRAAAHSVLDAKHARWQLEVVEPNAPARAFWRRVLAERGTFREETGEGEVVFLFET